MTRRIQAIGCHQVLPIPYGDGDMHGVIPLFFGQIFRPRRFAHPLDEQLTTNSGGVYSGTIDAPKLTADVLNKGDVAVYEKFSIIFPTASTTYNKVPYAQGSNWVRVELSVGEITVKSNTNHSLSTFRYVLIPGGIQASTASHLDLTDYRAVRHFYGLGND